MVAEDFLQDPYVRQWLDGVEPAWALLSLDSLRSLRQEPSAVQTTIRIANDLSTGGVQLSHSHVTTIDLNQFQFAAFLSQQSQPRLIGGGNYRKWYTPQRCHEDFVVVAAGQDHPPLRAVWCAHAYRQFEGLYDVSVIAVTEDRGREALVSRLNLQAVGYDDAMALSRRFFAAVQWTK